MICITCVDALLVTDMERVCRKAEEKVDIPVRPCYMYALTREGRKPPMVHVRQSLYSLLEPRRKKEMWSIFWDFSRRWWMTASCMIGFAVQALRPSTRSPDAEDFEEYQTMAEANFNLVLASGSTVMRRRIFMTG